jgi:hypothetical protein
MDSEVPMARRAADAATSGVRERADAAGLVLRTERLGLVAAAIAQVDGAAQRLAAVDLSAVAPAAAFDPRWDDDDAADDR